MTKKLNRSIKLLVFLSLSGYLLYLSFRNVNFGEVIDVLKTAQYWWLTLSFSFAIIAFFSRARRWILLIRPLGYKPTLWNAFHALMTGYLVNFALPRLGELSRCVALSKKEKVPVDKLFGTVIVERTFDLISLFIILIIMIGLRRELMGSFMRDQVILPLREKLISMFGFSNLFIITIIFILLILLFALYRYRAELQRIKIVAKMVDFIRGVFKGLKSFYTMENKIEFIFHTVVIWICYIMMTWVVVFMIPSTSHLTFADGTFLLVIGGLGMAAPVQGGIGAFHWIVSRGLHMVYDISLKDGLAFATIAHESQLILIAILGTISFYALFRSGRRKMVKNEIHGSNRKQEG